MKRPRLVFFSVFLLSVLILFSACSSPERYLQPTGKAAFVPVKETEFSSYVQTSQNNIQDVLASVRGEGAYLGGYSTTTAASMRAPFQILPTDSEECVNAPRGQKGFLLIHGLTDSPYLMKNIADSLHAAYPCALVRAVLLPGHGTVAGDSLQMRKQQWKEIVQYGVESLQHQKEINEVYLIGFSTGTSLIIDYLQARPAVHSGQRADKVAGVVLLSAALRAKTGLAFLTPWLRYVKDWASTFEERDAARYESFSLNAGAEFYTLTEPLDNPAYLTNVPMLMAVSADDATIDAQAARKFFCASAQSQRKTLLWYSSLDEKLNNEIAKNEELACENIIEIKPSSFAPEYKTLNMAHTALPVSPDDAHYGVQGLYHNCKEYDSESTRNDFDRCQDDDIPAVYGEDMKLLKKMGKLENTYFRRGTFNPDYKRMMEAIVCFSDQTCSLDGLSQ